MNLSKPQEFIATSTQDINLFNSGVGGGKTTEAGLLSGYFLENFPDAFGFIGANTHQQLTTSTLYRVRETWKEIFGWIEGRDYIVGKQPPKHFNTEKHNFDDYNSIISFKNGSIIFKGSLDNAKAHDGKEFCWAMLDETKDSREEDVKDVILTRLRKPGIYVDKNGQLTSDVTKKVKTFNPLYILTSPAKVRWINEWFNLDDYQEEILSLIYNQDEFFAKEYDDKCVVISSTYHNKKNLPDGYIERIERNQADGGKRLIYGNPFVKAGGEFYSSFDRTKHVKDVQFYTDLPIHISFDQNVRPYISMGCFQIRHEGEKRIVSQFDEICLSNPRNSTEALCNEFIKRHGSKVNGLFFYGDPSGKHADTRANENDYHIVERILKKYLNNRSNRVPFKHPPVIRRRDFMNNCFEGKYGIEIEIDRKCKNTIADFEFVKEDINGKKLKEKAKDEAGNTYEKYGHMSDLSDYFITEAFAAVFEREFK